MSNVHAAGAQRSKRNFTKKRWIALGVVCLCAVTGAAYAYFTTTGAGSASTQAGTSTALTISAVITPATGGLVPGGPAAPIVYSAANTGTGNQRVGTVHVASITAYSDAGLTTAIPACDSSWFSVADVAENQTIPGSATTELTTPGSLVFANVASSQDACKNAYLKLTITSN
jgi:hypothetical protein